MKVFRLLTFIIYTIIVCFAMTSCDPAKQIIIKNKSNKPVHFTWIMERDSISNDSIIRTVRTSNYAIGTKNSERRLKMIFGFGVWSTMGIDELVNNDIKVFKIEGVKTNISLTDKGEIKQYLKDRRRGLLNNFIIIEVY